MGQIQSASCACGFSSTITVGGGMRDFQTNAPFPHYCKTCGLVNANMQADPIACPTCQSQEVIAYGQPPISLPSEGRPGVEWGGYKAPRTGNLCPKCKEMTLEFEPATIMFD